MRALEDLGFGFLCVWLWGWGGMKVFIFFTYFLPGTSSTISLTEKNSCCIQSTPLVPLLHFRNNDFYFQYLELIETMGKCQCVSGKEQPLSLSDKPSQEV